MNEMKEADESPEEANIRKLIFYAEMDNVIGGLTVPFSEAMQICDTLRSPGNCQKSD